MGMQTDVKAVSRSTSGLCIGGRNRLKGLYFEVPVDNSCFVDFVDSLTGSGDAKVSFDLAGGDSGSMWFPGEGVLFATGIYLFISGENAPNITIFYG